MPLEVEINKYKEKINAVAINLNSTDMFLGYNWLVKHNPEVNWDIEMIQFIRCLKIYRVQY